MKAKVILETIHGNVVGDVTNVVMTHDGPFSVPRYEVEFYADEEKCRGLNIGKALFDMHNKTLDLSGNCENKSLKARKVIFNPPATIVLWEDGKKTVVKCDEDDTFDEMKGLALCYMKKALGNTSRELNKALRKGKNHASE